MGTDLDLDVPVALVGHLEAFLEAGGVLKEIQGLGGGDVGGQDDEVVDGLGDGHVHKDAFVLACFGGRGGEWNELLWYLNGWVGRWLN